MLEKQREEIDRLDRKIVELLEARMAVVTEVGTIKKEHGLDVLDTQREVAVIEKVESYVTNPLYRESIGAVYQAMMDISKEYQQVITGEGK